MATKIVQWQNKPSSDLRIVLVGKTGVGKSAAGNIILDKEAFKSELSSSSVTSECKKVKATINGRNISVIDTPGLFDTTFPNDEIVEKIKLCISLCAPGPHVFLVVISLSRFTKEEQETTDIIQDLFENASKYTMVLFTHGDMLKQHKTTIQEYISKSQKLTEFIASTSGRFHVFNNNELDPTQVNELLREIDELVIKNGGYYTNKVLQVAESAIQEEQKRLQMESQLDPTEARESAERSNKFLKTAAGVGFAAAAVGAVAVAVLKGKCTIL